MLALLEKVMLFVEPIALAVLLVYAYGFFSRSARSTNWVNLIMGVVFGLAASAAMSSPISIADGIIVDIRNLFIGLAAAYFGLVGACVAFFIGATARVFIGGEGMFLGIAAMSVAGIMGLIWASLVRPRVHNDILSLLMLGAMISAHLVVGIFLPPAIREAFYQGLGPTLLTANLLGAVILGQLIKRERMILDETDRLTSATMTDALTRLMNRNAAVSAYDALPDPVDHRHGVAMFCIDVDNFKPINDMHGHLRGDAVLVEVAKRMLSCLRPEDVCARLSGDEFMIVLNDITEGDAMAVANRCRDCVRFSPVVADDAQIDVSVSIGGIWLQGKPTFKVFRDLADQALYDAKSEGRDCVVLGSTGRDPEMSSDYQMAVA